MASSPQTSNKPSDAVSKLPPDMEAIAEALADGLSVKQVVQRLAKNDPKKARRIRQKIRRWSREDARFLDRIHANVRADMQVELPAVSRAVVARAGRGRIDAAKLAFAATGFHSDKVNHEHSGEIQLNISVPRPSRTEDHVAGPGKIEEGFVDADVVEDDNPGKAP